MASVTTDRTAGHGEREELRAVLRDFFEQRAPARATLELVESHGFDRGVWEQMGEQLVLQGLAIPERFGGQGFGLSEVAVALEESGRVAYSGPLLATWLAAEALLLSGDAEACAEYLPRAAVGATVLTLALHEPGASWAVDAPECVVHEGTLSGRKALVMHGAIADTFVVTARCEDGVGVFLVDSAAPGVELEPASVLDLTRPMADVYFHDAAATRVGSGDATALLETLTARAVAGLACEQAGGVRGCLELATVYASERLQFGRPIGSYQAVRHRCADMFAAAQTSAAAARHAIATLQAGAEGWRGAVAIAASHCSESYLRVAGDTIQTLGGIGFTWEHPAHLHFKRARASASLFGDSGLHRHRAAEELLDLGRAPGRVTRSGPVDLPDELQQPLAAVLAGFDPDRGADRAFRELQFDRGLAWVHHAPGQGGLGLPRTLQAHVDDALAQAGVPADVFRSGVGVPLVAPTLAGFGTDAHRARHLRRIFSGEEVWCQLFSEPGAGSDLAGLATSAVRKGEDWLVNGQKVWTSVGHAADWGILCARTDPGVPKHQGLTYFLVDMRSDGIVTRPLRQITGDAEFDEVFLTDVMVPDANRVGEPGEGWAVTIGTLANERRTGGAVDDAGDATLRLLQLWRDHGEALPHLRSRVLELVVASEVLRVTAAEADASERAGSPSPAWSFLKLSTSELGQQVLDLAMTLLGEEGLRYSGYAMRIPNAMEPHAVDDVQRAFLYARAMTIGGGTSDIQRTIIADRMLRLPREPQLDRDLPWRDIPRN